jgi:S-adenosylmethionine:tRNA ribosyltransferase-isomerase
VQLADFDFDLPDQLIAQEPRPRGGSRLLVVDRSTGTWTESRVADLAQWVAPGDVVVANDSKVFPARLLGRRAGGGRAECFLLHRAENELGGDFLENRLRAHFWWALVNPGQRLPVGAPVDFTDAVRAPGITLTGAIVDRDAEGRRLVRLTAGGASVAQAIDALGHMPLPPYIRRPDSAADRERYQTMFAREEGSIAAPTAGLHFDDALIASLTAAGVAQTTVTLHVGYGTFKPVKVEDVREHRVDPETYEVSEAAVQTMASARAQGGRVVAVGTTTTRTLESAARATGVVSAGHGHTDLCILPGHTFRAVDILLTNFHLPKSSLLLLVAAFGGRDLVLAAYRDAIARGFAFYSYGDAMLIR